MNKPKLLLLTDWFPPAYKAGGPIRSTANFSQAMSQDYEVFVLSTNQDYGGEQINVEADIWQEYESAIPVKYLSKEALSYQGIVDEITWLKPDFIYLNSLYSFHFSIIPLLARYQQKTEAKIILAPRGMLQAGALQYKSRKKQIFLWVLKQIKFYQGVYWHATDEQEKRDIVNNLKVRPDFVVVIPNFPTAVPSQLTKWEKNTDVLDLVFISRVSPKKNLAFFLKQFLKIKQEGTINLNIYGPQEDNYWSVCKEIIKRLPANIRVKYNGSVTHDKIPGILNNHHYFILPTYGENFGHAIFEAFAAGLPVIISDQTPWKDLKPKNIGWDIPLSEPIQYVQAIETCLAMDQTTYDQMSKAAWQFATDFTEKSGLIEKYRALFSIDTLE